MVRGVRQLGFTGSKEDPSSGSPLADRLSDEVLEKLKAIGGGEAKEESKPKPRPQTAVKKPSEASLAKKAPVSRSAPLDAIEHGLLDGVAWYLDPSRRLVIEPAHDNGGFIRQWGLGRFPWYKIRSKIEQVLIKPGVAACRLDYAFVDCQKLVEADLSGLDASELKGMTGILSKCSNLRTVSFKGWSPAELRSVDVAVAVVVVCRKKESESEE